MVDTAIIVPCRLESTRFPRKLLYLIRGKPLVLWVAERLRSECGEFPLYFAVDDELLSAPLVAAGFQVIRTRKDHASGTDRLAEANQHVKANHVINVQADEPLVTGAQVRALAQLIRGPVAMATLATRFTRAEDFANPNQVKVVLRRDGRALYFTRSAVPFARDLGGQVTDAWVAQSPCLRHLGLYAYRQDLLSRFASLPGGQLEQLEKLEQLRVLEHGFDIAVGLTEDPSIGVDTHEDAIKFEAVLGRQGVSE